MIYIVMLVVGLVGFIIGYLVGNATAVASNNFNYDSEPDSFKRRNLY